MVVHGETGFLANDEDEMAYYTARLVHEPGTRTAMTEAARAAVEDHTNPETLISAWRKVLE
jgi:glycosyltransferase involved in cell wall biosynthesis